MSDVSLNEQPEAARVEIVADPASHGGWHLDRRVPAALIIAVMIQTGGIVWWAASLSAAKFNECIIYHQQ